MSRRNRPPAPERPTGAEFDPRTTEEVTASIRRKLLFILIALAAVPTSIGLSWAANRARDNLMISLLPVGVSMTSRVPGENGPTVRDALARFGAYPEGHRVVDFEGRPIVFQRAGKPLPYRDATTPDPEGEARGQEDGEDTPQTKPRIVEVD